MPPSDTPPLRLRPDIGYLPKLIEYIETTGEEAGLKPADVMAFSIAAEELFANTLHYSLPPATSIEFSLTCTNGLATAIYSDDAAPFDPTAQAGTDTTQPLDQLRIGGLGIQLIRTTMPVFTYERTGTSSAGRNIVTFARPMA
jgi:anti-sigma regulatory factor (Ser/Thr protein kinase)